MLTTLMGAAVFSIGFFMLILGLLDLLNLSGLNFGLGERILLYVGGLFLCILGYVMARRLPRIRPGAYTAPVLEEQQAPLPPVETTQPQGPPPDHL